MLADRAAQPAQCYLAVAETLLDGKGDPLPSKSQRATACSATQTPRR